MFSEKLKKKKSVLNEAWINQIKHLIKFDLKICMSSIDKNSIKADLINLGKELTFFDFCENLNVKNVLFK